MTQFDPEDLKNILENIHRPDSLDDHPWACSLFVKDLAARQEQVRTAGSGQQLVVALAEVFASNRPSTPPRRGKRLDTRWGEFGLLAALYFAPARFGAPAPTSLRDAWGRIDQSILLFVNSHENGSNGSEREQAYSLVSGEPEVAPVSTLSDWHRKGILRLAEALTAREAYLQKFPPPDDLAVDAALPEPDARPARSRFLRPLLISLTALLLVLAGLGAYKGRQVYRLGMTLREDLTQMRALAGSHPDLTVLARSGPLLGKTQQDLAAFRVEVKPFLWLAPRLGWVPAYGGDLAASPDLLEIADLLLLSAEVSLEAAEPFVNLLEGTKGPRPTELVAALRDVEPQLIAAREAVSRAVQLRAGLDLERLSPLTRSYIERDLDPLLPVMEDGLALATNFPQLLGAASDGPKTYLLLVQNEDELRPTGGFITAVGTLVVQNGQVLSLSFVDSGALDNWDMPYPAAPWQLEDYMNSPVLVLRDSNWFPDYPTSALYAESLYAYNSAHSVDGVIAFDQHMLVLMLEALGPLQVEGASEPVTAQNVISYMRASKTRPTDEPTSTDWTSKDFLHQITGALLVKLFEKSDFSWMDLGLTVLKGLNGHHLLVFVDDPNLAAVVTRRDWDGAVRHEAGDFLMVVDANLGFNKTNAVVETALTYDVDLTDTAHPVASLTVTHLNHASPAVPCVHWGAERAEDQREYPIDACYWSYTRVYVPSGAELLDATPQDVPADWMILGEAVQGPVDLLEEDLEGLDAFGTLLVVRGGQSRLTSFQYHLPEHVLRQEGDRFTYRLTVEKQPGTIAVPITIRIHLPNDASLAESIAGAIQQGNHLYLEADLATDLELQVSFGLR